MSRSPKDSEILSPSRKLRKRNTRPPNSLPKYSPSTAKLPAGISRKKMIGVAVVHILIFSSLLWNIIPKKKPLDPMKNTIEMVDLTSSTTPQPSPSQQPPQQSPPPRQTPPTHTTITPTPTPLAPQTTSSPTPTSPPTKPEIKKPPKPKTPTTAKPTSTKKPKPPIQISKTLITRNQNTPSTPRPTSISTNKLASTLHKRLNSIAVKSRSGSPINSDFAWFHHLLTETIRRNWNYSEKWSNLSTTVGIRIDPNGNLTPLGIVKSSGNSEFDQSVLQAIRKTKKLQQKLPDGLGNPDYEINALFK